MRKTSRDPSLLLWPVVAFVVLAPLLVWRSRVVQRRVAENLQKLALLLRLDFRPAENGVDSPCLTGSLRGRRAEVFRHVTGAGRSRRAWVVISVQPAKWETLTFTLQKQGLGTKISELLGAREITVGDAAFDAAWYVETNQPEYFRAALLPELREKLMAVRRAGAEGKFELRRGEVKYIEPDQLNQSDGIELLVALADVTADLAEIAEVAGARDGLV